MRNVRHEIAPDLIHFLQLRDVLKQYESASDFAGLVLCSHDMQLDLRFVESQLVADRSITTECIGEQAIQRRITNNFQQWRSQWNFRCVEEFSKCLVSQNYL